MTTLLAYHDGKRGYLAADRRCMAGSEIVTDSATKITRAGKWLIATAGASLAGNLVRANADKLANTPSMWDLARALKECFRDSGWEGEPGEKCAARSIDSSFLVASPDESGIIFSNFSSQVQDRPCPGGSGGSYAVGAFLAYLRAWEFFHRLSDTRPIEAYMREAVLVACHYDHNSGGEPQVEVTE